VEPELSDTDPETERVHLELIRGASAARRLHLALSLSRTAMELCRANLQRESPAAPPDEVGLRFVALSYSPRLAEGVRSALAALER
jgi:hypothetical protein